VVQVDRKHRVLPQPVQRCCGCGRGLPRRVDVPPATCRVVADVVAHRAVGRLGGDLIAPVGEPDRGRQPVAAVRPVRQVGKRDGQLDLQPALAGVPADRLVAPRFAFLSVGGEEQPGRLPLTPPPGLGHASLGEIAALAQQRLAAPHHRHPSRLHPPVHPGEPGLQRLQASRLRVALCRGGIPAHPARLPAGRDQQPCLDPVDADLQRAPLGAQVLPGQPDLILTGAGDRASPPRGRLRRERLLPPGCRFCWAASRSSVCCCRWR
jgi:hypothetical protein